VTPARVGAGLMALGLALWGLALFVGLPFLYGKKVGALVGQTLATVRQELGAPKDERRLPDGGLVLHYADGEQGWFLVFGDGQRLAAVRHYGAPDAGPDIDFR
jgi:hypothetical protein